MDPADSDWLGEGPDDGSSVAGLGDLHGGLIARPLNSRASIDRGPPAHESQRRTFATGPEAQDAAMTLHHALQIPTPLAISATFLDRAVGRVDHRFNDRGGAMVARKRDGPFRI